LKIADCRLVGHARLDAKLIAYLQAEGFYWSTEHECYRMEHERFSKWNNKPIELGKHSFEVDAYHREMYPAYGGDCVRHSSLDIRHS